MPPASDELDRQLRTPALQSNPAAATQVGPVSYRAVTTESIRIQFPVWRTPLAREAGDRKFSLCAPAWSGNRARARHRKSERRGSVVNARVQDHTGLFSILVICVHDRQRSLLK